MSAPTAGQRIRRARHGRGLTLEAAAGLVGHTKGWLSMIENGKLPVTRFSDIIALAEVLRATVPALTGTRCPGCPLRHAGDDPQEDTL